MHNAIQYQLEVPTARNRAFVKRWMAMFPDDPYIGEMAQNTYFTVHLYAKAAPVSAGTTDQRRSKHSNSVDIEAPEGSASLSRARITAHIRSGSRSLTNHDQFVVTGRSSKPGGCNALASNLIRNPEYKQYTPDEDPYFKMFGAKIAARWRGTP